MSEIKVLTATRLRCLNNHALRTHGMAAVAPQHLTQLPTDQLFPVLHHMLHNDRHVRVTVVLDVTVKVGTLDIEISDFNLIPTIDSETLEITPCPDAATSSAAKAATLQKRADTSLVNSSRTTSTPSGPRPSVKPRGAPARSRSPRVRSQTKQK